MASPEVPSRVVSAEELSAANGQNGGPVYLAIKGVVYDVTEGANFYGPGGAYAAFAGKECSRGLGKMSVRPEDVNGNISDLTENQLNTLENWIKRFNNKYPIIGTLAGAAAAAAAAAAAQ